MYIILTIVILFLFSDREEPIEPTSVFTEITKAEETFYHPITGYKGTSTEMLKSRLKVFGSNKVVIL